LPGGRSRDLASDRKRLGRGTRVPLDQHDDRSGDLRVPGLRQGHQLRRQVASFAGGRRRQRRLLAGRALMLSAESRQKIDREIAKYPPERKQSAVMSALIIAQDEKGWLSTETMDTIAEYLGMPPVAVYEVASFY